MKAPRGQSSLQRGVCNARRSSLQRSCNTPLVGYLWVYREGERRETTMAQTTETRPEVRPFRIDVPEEDLVDLRRRIAATQWPEKETVADDSQGVRLAAIQELARYWATDYDWRRCEE